MRHIKLRRSPVKLRRKSKKPRHRSLTKFPPPPLSPQALLSTRRQTAVALNASVGKVIRLEKAGKLDVVKLLDAENSIAHHRVDQVRQLAQGGTRSTTVPPKRSKDACGERRLRAAELAQSLAHRGFCNGK